jgi:hypothetical protein
MFLRRGHNLSAILSIPDRLVKKNLFCVWRFSTAASAFLDRSTTAPVEEGIVNRSLELGIVLGFIVFAPREVHGKQTGQQSRPDITVVVCDQVGIASEIWLTAKQQSIRILDNAGVDVVWIDAAAKSCMPQSLDAYFVVVVSPKAPKGWATFGTMGFALRTGSHPRAYVFYDLVRSFVRNFQPSDPFESSVGVILGHAIAHEVGHLLIPGDAHGAGIMRANWSYKEWREALAGALLFHPDDVKVIQEQLRSR